MLRPSKFLRSRRISHYGIYADVMPVELLIPPYLLMQDMLHFCHPILGRDLLPTAPPGEDDMPSN